jgi:hypothetical protein
MYVIDATELLLEGGRRDLVAELAGDPQLRAGALMESVLSYARAMLEADAGEHDLAQARLQASLNGLRAARTPYLLARCLYRHGALLIDRDRGAEAAAPLHEARALFAGLGAAPWVARSELLLAPVATAT